MYKVILVDDESVVRDGLKNTIDWQKHGFALAGDYANGREAWDAIEDAKPDLVISDISMPFMDGLELTGLIAANYPYIKVLILTGYDEFEYAQQAIRLKVSDFLLKPITAAEIRELLDKVRAEMDQEKQRREDLTRLHSQLHQSLPLLKERFLERLVAIGLSRPEIEERFAYFGIPAASPPYLALAADIDDFGDRETHFSDAHDAEFLRFAAFNIFEETVQHREDVLLFRTREERMVAVLYGHEDESALSEQAFGIAEEVRHLVNRFLGFTLTIGIGRPCASAEQLPQSYRGALSALDYRFLMGKNRVLGIADLEGEPVAARSPDEGSRRLAAAVRTGSAAEACAHIEDSVRELKRSRLPIEACFLHMQKLVLTLMDVMQELGIRSGSEALPLWLTDVYKFKTLDEIERWLKEIVSAITNAAASSRSRFIREQVGKATAYIEANYSSDRLTLQEICRHVLMSTSHFSQMFKQHTGETFIEYLTRVRMDKAKTLLRTTPLKFYEIAGQVGYADPNYFSLLFKKHAGLSPRDFRDLPAGEESR